MTVIYNRDKFLRMNKTPQDKLIGFVNCKGGPIIFYDMFAIASTLHIIEKWNNRGIELYFRGIYLKELNTWYQDNRKGKEIVK